VPWLLDPGKPARRERARGSKQEPPNAAKFHLIRAMLTWCRVVVAPGRPRCVGSRHPLAPTAALLVGVGLLIWVAVEVAIIGYSNEPSLQAIYGILGVAIVLVAVRSLQGVGIGKGLSLAKC